MSRVGLLLGISYTRVKTRVRKQDPAYASPFPRTQSLKNRPTYARTELCTHECKLCMQARAHTYKNIDKSSFSTFSKKHHPKSILDMFLPLLRC